MKIGRNLGPPIAACPRRQSFTLALSVALAVSVGGMIALAFPETASAGETEPPPNVTILIYNDAQVTRAVLTGAERKASRIFAEADISILWFECPAVPSTTDPQRLCQNASETKDIRLQLLSAPVKSKSQDRALGLAVLPDLASVYYEYVVRRADDYGFEVDGILGSVIAHEIGHLLLGPNSHYGIGIMQPQWSFEQVQQAMMGTLLFTPEQSKRIRAAARTRMSQQSASLREQNMVTVDQWCAGAIEPEKSVCEYTWKLVPRPTQGSTQQRNGIGDRRSGSLSTLGGWGEVANTPSDVAIANRF